ncbi:hypothetical protein BJ878DRAFT_205531 [Calycina marina]|uniref:Adenosine deaminase n=1 Tax=Calycina marina TaxID=1763456 RepID=A0A9P8CJ93_9HELO|nr:hypothetical protein BJ878DRAFT_205531 [Calycina marina]
MGSFCSTNDKDGEEPTRESRPQTAPQRRLSKRKPSMNIARREKKPLLGWRAALNVGLDTPEIYEAARLDLKSEELTRAFDAGVTKLSSNVEQQAVEIVKKIQWYDWKNTYGCSTNAPPKGKRMAGQHFLGSVDLINQTELLKVAKKMPKGAHLHIHFSSCLPATFPIQQARNIDAMYIRSTLPLTTPENMDATRVSFMIMKLRDATHSVVSGVEVHTPFGDISRSDYVANSWMPYKKFLKRFKYRDQSGQLLQGVSGAEKWLVSKILFSEEGAHDSQQTGHG